MSEEQDNQVRDRLHQIFPDEKTANRVVEIVTSKKPVGWGRRSYAPYYKEVYAIQIREVIDDMISTRNSVVYRYQTFCNPTIGMSENSLYFKINQSIRFLLDFMDKDGIYKKWYQMIRIRKKKNFGIELSYLPEFQFDMSGLKPELVLPREMMPQWRRRLEEWIESDDSVPFVQDKIALSSDDIKWLKESLKDVPGIMPQITSSSIKIVRINL